MGLKEKWENTLVVSQDVIRRDVIGCKDVKNNPAIEVIEALISEAINKYEYVILEGILKQSIYYEMIGRLIELYNPCSQLYYLSVSFEATKCRHLESSRADEFSIEKMKQWWLAKDLLGYKGEVMIDAEVEQTNLREQLMSYNRR